jgi:hypothetical protein
MFETHLSTPISQTFALIAGDCNTTERRPAAARSLAALALRDQRRGVGMSQCCAPPAAPRRSPRPAARPGAAAATSVAPEPAAFAALRTELRGLRVTQLQARATAEGCVAAAVEDALDGDAPKVWRSVRARSCRWRLQ